MQIQVKQSTEKKDRYTLLSNKTLKLLREYIKVYKPNYYLIEGQGSTKENPMPNASQSIKASLKESAKKLVLPKK